MTDKTEAQPEALYVAEQLDATRHAFGDDNAQSKRRASAELRRQHAEIEQIKAQLSARQAAPDGWRLVPAEPTEEMVTAGQESFGVHDCYYAMLSAAPPPPEREPLTLAQIDGIGDATGKPSFTWHYEFARAIERAHGIGATNDNP